jgi:ATP-dependent Lon protease
MEMDKQHKLIKELREINKITRIEKPYRMTLLESSIPVEYKAAAMKKINSLRYMEPGSGEFYKSKNWVDTFMRIPFNKYEGLPITIDDGVDKCHEFMDNAKQTLDNAVYGLNDAKMQIMQMLGQLLTNPQSIGTAIAIHGPPGTGKTSLVKEGISKILNRPFTFIALGGATDSSFLEGHSYTYEGSTWGKIVQIIIESKCMNPVIYFDELDKISDTPRGEEIAGILTHLTDTSQNSQFHDKYFADINFDLSKCLFIFSYNDETKVNPILKDRMYRIKTKGYVSKEKTIIANNYLLPKIREQVRFVEGQIIIPNDVISHVIDTHCNKEDGVRNLKRCLEIIHTKLNLYRLMKPGSNLFEGEMSLNVEFPFTVTKAIVDKLIKRETDGLETWRSLYA